VLLARTSFRSCLSRFPNSGFPSTTNRQPVRQPAHGDHFGGRALQNSGSALVAAFPDSSHLPSPLHDQRSAQPIGGKARYKLCSLAIRLPVKTSAAPTVSGPQPDSSRLSASGLSWQCKPTVNRNSDRSPGRQYSTWKALFLQVSTYRGHSPGLALCLANPNCDQSGLFARYSEFVAVF